MKILIFNLRDVKHPESGGAEVFTHEVAKELVAFGNTVTMVVSNYPSGKPFEVVDGVEIVRLGNIYTVHRMAKKHYETKLRGKFDIVIDEYTWKPFLTPKFVKEKIVFLVHELAREKYFYQFPPLVSHAFYHYFEPKWLSYYTSIPTITVSKSTKKDLMDIGYSTVYIVPEGINFRPMPSIPKKEMEPTSLFVGLLKKCNLVDSVIDTFRLVKEKIPDAKLWIVGRGSELERLKQMAKGLDVTFFGRVSHNQKLDLMGRAHVLLMPAIREGWGLVVTEANACGTPAIGYRVPGLRDSIKHGETGLLVDNNPQAMADKTVEYFLDSGLRMWLTRNALTWSAGFTWTETAKTMSRILERLVNGNRQRPSNAGLSSGINYNTDLQLH